MTDVPVPTNPVFRLLVLATLLAASGPGAGAQTPRQSFDLVVPTSPVPVTVAGTTRLVYELHITNFAADTLRLTRLEVLEADSSGRRMADFERDALESLLEGVGFEADDSDPPAVEPGGRSVAFFWLAVDAAAGVPQSLLHRLTYRVTGEDGPGSTVMGGRVAVSPSAPPALMPPLRGGPWVAVYFPSMARGHRRVLLPLDGRVHIPARFAIDWMKIDEHGRLASGDATRVANWHGYGADVLAVGHGTVVAVRSSVEESQTVEHVAHGLTKETGNHITLDLGNGLYVSYEHLRPGSVLVSLGDRVQAGQTIAQLGYTGDSGGPHLHMHVSDGPAPLEGEGLPFVITAFEYLGEYSFGESLGDGRWTPTPDGPETRTRELPAPNSVVHFGSAARGAQLGVRH